MPGDFGDSTSGRYDGYGQVDPLAPSVGNGQIGPEQWAEYMTKRRRAAILGILGTVGGMAGAGALGGALGGGGAEFSGALAEAPFFGAGATASPFAAGSIATGVGASGGAAAGGGAAAAGGAGAGAAGAAKGLLGGMSARDWAALAASGVGTVGGLMSNGPVQQPTSATNDPNMQKLIQSMQGRLNQSEPLYKSIMAMANGLLPTQYQNGGAGR